MIVYPRVIVFGDSIVWGSYDFECGGWVNRLAAYYMKRDAGKDENVDVYNRGICGDYVHDVLVRFEHEIDSLESRWGEQVIVVIACGINDSAHDVRQETPDDEFRRDYGQLLEHALHKTGGRVLAIEPTNVIDQNDPEAFSDSSVKTRVELIREMCEKYSVTLVPMHGKLEPSDFYEDGLHPSPAGHQKMADLIRPHLEELIKDATVDID